MVVEQVGVAARGHLNPVVRGIVATSSKSWQLHPRSTLHYFSPYNSLGTIKNVRHKLRCEHCPVKNSKVPVLLAKAVAMTG